MLCSIIRVTNYKIIIQGVAYIERMPTNILKEKEDV
jgi:hypothetical protein